MPLAQVARAMVAMFLPVRRIYEQGRRIEVPHRDPELGDLTAGSADLDLEAGGLFDRARRENRAGGGGGAGGAQEASSGRPDHHVPFIPVGIWRARGFAVIAARNESRRRRAGSGARRLPLPEPQFGQQFRAVLVQFRAGCARPEVGRFARRWRAVPARSDRHRRRQAGERVLLLLSGSGTVTSMTMTAARRRSSGVRCATNRSRRSIHVCGRGPFSTDALRRGPNHSTR